MDSDSTDSDSNTRWGRLFACIVMFVIGMLLLIFCVDGIVNNNQSDLGKRIGGAIGISFIVTGIMSFFNEVFLKKSETVELSNKLVQKLSKSDDVYNKMIDKIVHSDEISKKMIDKLATSDQLQKYETNNGILLKSMHRANFAGYREWLYHEPTQIVIVGRAVLPRIQSDATTYFKKTAEQIIASKFFEGADIQILFFDPLSEIIPKIAAEEGRPPAMIYSDIGEAIGICAKLYMELRNGFPKNGSYRKTKLVIGMYDEVHQFAYQKHVYNDQIDNHTYLGFYLGNSAGFDTPVFEIVDSSIQNLFASYVTAIKKTDLLTFLPNDPAPRLDLDLYKKLYIFCLENVVEPEKLKLSMPDPESL